MFTCPYNNPAYVSIHAGLSRVVILRKRWTEKKLIVCREIREGKRIKQKIFQLSSAPHFI